MKRPTALVAIVVISIILLSPVRAQSGTPFPTSAIRAAYDVNPLLQSGYTGKAVTVAIVNTGIDSTFYTDLKVFSNLNDLPNPVISVVQPFGPTETNQELPKSETTADAEFVHSMAPDAKLLMVLVGTHSILAGFSYVIDNNAADIVTLSPSWAYWGQGANDLVQSYNNEYAKSVGQGITLIAASNDWGSNNSVPWGTVTGDFWTKHLPYSYLMPQYSPYVTAVGGTTLTLQSGSYGSESGWDRSGGGPSNLFSEPTWQTGIGVPENGFRNIPDIALDASCNTPYAYYWNGGSGSFCGTSGAAPTFAGIVADIMQAKGSRLGFLNPMLYSIASTDPSVYHDVTAGCSLVEVGSSTQTGYCAHAGWDFVTGWGSIDASRLAKHLAPKVVIVSEFPSGSAGFLITSAITVTLCAVCLRSTKVRREMGISTPIY
jgi:kumamolisin